MEKSKTKTTREATTMAAAIENGDESYALIDISNEDYITGLDSVIYDHTDERFVNNANSGRRFALHIRIRDLKIERVFLTETDGIIIAHLGSRFCVPLLEIEEKLVDIINATPHFSEEDESELTIITSKSFIRQDSKGSNSIRLEIDMDSENRSLFFEKTDSDDPPEIPADKLKKNMTLDAVVQVLVDIDVDRHEAFFTTVIEECSVIPNSTKSSKRRPMILTR